MKTNLQKVTFHNVGVTHQLVAAAKPALPLGLAAAKCIITVFTVYRRMPGTKVSQYSSLGKKRNSPLFSS
jgi:hypothetical protein